MIASEAQPFSKTGGLADVATALPKALGRLGHDVTVITPRYRGVTDGPVVGTVSLEMAAHRFNARLMQAPGLREDASASQAASRVRVLLLDCPELYDRDGIYYNAQGDFADNAVRYAFLSAAAIDWAAQQSLPFDIIHSHDWQGGLAPAYAGALACVPCVPCVRCRRFSPSTTWLIRASSTRAGFRAWVCVGKTSRSTALSFSID